METDVYGSFVLALTPMACPGCYEKVVPYADRQAWHCHDCAISVPFAAVRGLFAAGPASRN